MKHISTRKQTIRAARLMGAAFAQRHLDHVASLVDVGILAYGSPGVPLLMGEKAARELSPRWRKLFALTFSGVVKAAYRSHYSRWFRAHLAALSPGDMPRNRTEPALESVSLPG